MRVCGAEVGAAGQGEKEGCGVGGKRTGRRNGREVQVKNTFRVERSARLAFETQHCVKKSTAFGHGGVLGRLYCWACAVCSAVGARGFHTPAAVKYTCCFAGSEGGSRRQQPLVGGGCRSASRLTLSVMSQHVVLLPRHARCRQQTPRSTQSFRRLRDRKHQQQCSAATAPRLTSQKTIKIAPALMDALV